MMPKGVEHDDLPTMEPASTVRIPMMPKGVEHFCVEQSRTVKKKE